MVTAEQVLAIARTQIGTVQAKDGSNPYGRAYGMDRVAWCAEFVWWCFQQAGAGALIHPKTAYTPTLADWFRAGRAFDTVPRPGDLVFYDWPDSVARIQHVGIVEAVEPGSIVTIEGNTTSGTAGDQSNGGGVWRRRRARNSSIVGYGHPAYTAPAPAAPAITVPEEDIVATLADLESLLDRKLAGVVRETTTSLPNRRGPGGAFQQGGPADTLFGYAMNADGSAYRIEQQLSQLVKAAQAGGVDAAALAKALAPLLAPLIAAHLAAGFTAAARAA